MNNIILKIDDGELFNFFDSESRKSFTVGSKRNCDVVIKSSLVAPMQLRCVCKDDVWYVEDVTPDGFKSEVLIGGKRFRRPIVRLDNEIVIRKPDDKHSKDAIRISIVKKISRRRSGSKVDLAQKTVTTVGRNASCDIVLDNPMVSEKHFRIIYDGKSCFIEDLHTINGTYVNNRKIRRAELKDYDRISIPSAAYTFYDKKLLFSTSPAGIQIDAVGVCKEVTDRKTRAKIRLVDSVSFRIEAGDFVAIVGGSGTGKSTLLDCVNGIRPATGGGIYYDTNSYYENIKSYKAVIGYVPQKDIMHDDLTLEQGLYYTARLRMRSSMFKDEVKQRVAQAIADVSLAGWEHVKISSLSGGQRKRVSIAMELLSDPKVIFLDEPTSGLSPDLDLEMMGLLKELASKGRTIVVITHAMENLDKCDKIAFLGKGGKLCFYGRHDEIFRYFNRKSYSRIFAALNNPKVCEYFELKYRASDYYKKLYSAFVALYGESINTLLPPVKQQKPKRTAKSGGKAQSEQPPAPLPDDDNYEDFAFDRVPEETPTAEDETRVGEISGYVSKSARRRGAAPPADANPFDVIPEENVENDGAFDFATLTDEDASTADVEEKPAAEPEALTAPPAEESTVSEAKPAKRRAARAPKAKAQTADIQDAPDAENEAKPRKSRRKKAEEQPQREDDNEETR